MIGIDTDKLSPQAQELIKNLQETYKLDSVTATIRCILNDYQPTGKFAIYARKERSILQDRRVKAITAAQSKRSNNLKEQARKEVLNDLKNLSADELLDMLIKLKESK
jgi:hypothetical protein